ncbi:transketolase [Salipaludibacillus aurantiacus]|uniref:Transketolase n=1 Tax=Salipaludibacillus aurantiacus TaxID=1601833 RepID=A0A1H9UBW9_9BACI|nr:transketolase [Salipaludibacillus aurantiacus]SES06667.1 transketolase [Salipaludibacillus aurantiacus]
MVNLHEKAREIRKGILRTVYTQKQGHIGGPLSAADVLAVLYFDKMAVKPEEPEWTERDRFVLSKGHSAIALYVTLALKGYFEYDELYTFDALHSRLQAHPDMTKLPGIDMSTGSLGQGISAGVGMALAAKLQKKDYKTYVMLGDGESQEGQVWEAAAVAARYNLSNLAVIVDNNGLQQYGWKEADSSERQTPDVRFEEKWKAFGWKVLTVDGHQLDEIAEALDAVNDKENKQPVAIIAQTVKGKGISFMEGQYEWHSKVPTESEFNKAMKELGEVMP